MGGLGNGRRGGRSPPLMIAALIACILVLGFNYWVSSSRNLELQTKLYELEGQVRRGVAERGAAEMKKNEFEGEIQKQKAQMSHIENVYQRKLEEAQDTCSQVKATLQLNISSSTKTIQELKGQLNQLNDDLGKLQKELQSCQGNVNTLNNKLTYDMTHCHSQVLSQKELCDERVAAAKLEVQKKMEKLIPPAVAHLENTLGAAEKVVVPALTGPDGNHTAAPVESHTPSFSEPKEQPPAELLSNDIMVDKAAVDTSVVLPPTKDLSKAESVPSPAAVKQDTLQPPEGAVKQNEGESEAGEPENNLTEDKEVKVMDTHEEVAQTEDPGMEGMLISQGKADETRIEPELEEAEDYDEEEQAVGGVDLEKQQQSKGAENIEKDLKQEMADYNGDEENEGEYEADKQAELAQI